MWYGEILAVLWARILLIAEGGNPLIPLLSIATPAENVGEPGISLGFSDGDLTSEIAAKGTGMTVSTLPRARDDFPEPLFDRAQAHSNPLEPLRIGFDIGIDRDGG